VFKLNRNGFCDYVDLANVLVVCVMCLLITVCVNFFLLLFYIETTFVTILWLFAAAISNVLCARRMRLF
jgi:hypothetical protein